MQSSRNSRLPKLHYVCPYCKRPVIVHDKKGVIDGPTIRPKVPRWCTGTCDFIIGLFTIYEHMADHKKNKEAKKVVERIKKEVIDAFVERDKDHRER